MEIKALALDPGRTTGYAMGHIEEKGKMIVVTGEMEWNHAALLAQLEWYKPHIIIYEKFDFRRAPKYQRDKVDLFPRELIGVVELYAAQHEDEVKLYTQSASSAKGYYIDKKLREDGVYRVAKPHANDAARHLLHWYTFGPGYRFNVDGFEYGGR
jgi:hypothetical protein